MAPLPDNALVVRGGGCEPDNFTQGSGVFSDAAGLLSQISVQCAPGKTALDLSRRMLNGKIGVTTVGEVRSAGGEVDPNPKPGNPDHCLLRGINAFTASRLFTPTIPNPHRVK